MSADVVGVLREVSRRLAAGAPADEIAAPAESSGLFDDVEVDEDEPAELVDLALADATHVTRDELERAFGQPSELPLLHPGRPKRVAYYPAEIASGARVAVIASLADDGANVQAITLRRDEL